jgi:hypothetical protein
MRSAGELLRDVFAAPAIVTVWTFRANLLQHRIHISGVRGLAARMRSMTLSRMVKIDQTQVS